MIEQSSGINLRIEDLKVENPDVGSTVQSRDLYLKYRKTFDRYDQPLSRLIREETLVSTLNELTEFSKEANELGCFQLSEDQDGETER